MPLSNTAIINAKPTDKPYVLTDERGLSVQVQPSGGKWWRFRYRFDGKAKMLSLGVYPDVGLKDAREKRDEARKLLAAGVDPGEHRKALKAAKSERSANSFEVICREWLEQRKDTTAGVANDRHIASRSPGMPSLAGTMTVVANPSSLLMKTIS